MISDCTKCWVVCIYLKISSCNIPSRSVDYSWHPRQTWSVCFAVSVLFTDIVFTVVYMEMCCKLELVFIVHFVFSLMKYFLLLNVSLRIFCCSFSWNLNVMQIYYFTVYIRLVGIISNMNDGYMTVFLKLCGKLSYWAIPWNLSCSE